VPINKDFNQLERIYSHSDSTTTVAGTQKKDNDENRKKKKGRSDKRDRKGHRNGRRDRHQHAGVERIRSEGSASETVTIETLPDGQMVVTFITWAQPPTSQAP